MKSPAGSRRGKERSPANTAANAALSAKTWRRQKRSTPGALVELAVIIAVALGLALAIQHWVIKPYQIPSGSMEPTLRVHQRVLVDRIFSSPHVGQITVFHPPDGAEQQECGGEARRSPNVACDRPNPHEDTGTNFIKRIVAGPGDEIYVSEGHVFRKAAGKTSFVREKDSYIRPCAGAAANTVCNMTTPIKIPPGHWFMMGDNRGESDDSRFWGPVPSGWIIGNAIATYWPPDRIGIF